MSFFAHLGKTEVPMVYQLQVHDVANLNCQEALQCFITRNKKAYQTRMAMSDGHTCKFDEILSFVSTIYSKKGKLDKKIYNITVKTDGAKGPRLSLSGSLGSGSSRSSVSLSTEIDLAEMAQERDWGKEVTRVFPLNGAGSGDSKPILKITFKVAPVKKGLEAVAAERAHRGHQQSISLSAASPLQHSESLSSFSRPTDEASPELANRPFVNGTAASTLPEDSPAANPGHRRIVTPNAEATARNLALLARGQSRRNVYGEMEDDNRARGEDSPRSTADNRSYAVEDDPPNAAPPGTRAPGAPQQLQPPRSKPISTSPSPSPTPHDEPPSADGQDAEEQRGRLKYQKRRSETQLFSQIMVDAVNRETSQSVTSPPSAVSLSRKPSVLAPLPSPQVVSRRVSAAQTPSHASANDATSPHAGLTVATNPEDLSSAPRRTDLGSLQASPEEDVGGGFQSYADLADDDTAPPLPSEPQTANETLDDDNEDASHGTSFADRHGGLTVEDLMAPGFSAAPATTTAAPSKRRGHGRNISMFSNAEKEGAQAVEEILRPQTTRSSAIGKFFGIDSSKKISTTKHATPPGSLTPKTPQAPLSAQSFTTGVNSLPSSYHHLGHYTQSMTSVHTDATGSRKLAGAAGKREEEPSTSGQSRSSRQAIDDALDGVNPILAISTTNEGASSAQHSRQPSRQVSRSSSPSRQSTASTGVPVSTAGGSLVAPSPRSSSKPTFPTTSPAKHSQAHSSLRATRTGSPHSSLSKEDVAKQLAAGAPPPSPGQDANGEYEAGSYAAWKASTKAKNRLRASSRSSAGSMSLSPSDILPVSKTLPRPAVSSTVPKTNRPHSSSLSRDQAAALTQAAAHQSNPSLSVSIASSGPDASPAASPMAAVGPAVSGVTLSEVAEQERAFQVKTYPAVQQLLEQLHVPDLAVESDEPSQSQSPPVAASSPPAAVSTATSPQQQKSIWSSIKTGFASAAGKETPQSQPQPTNPSRLPKQQHNQTPARRPSPNVLPSSPLEDILKTAYHDGAPTWPVITLRCLAQWDAFAVSSVVADDSQIIRLASRSWILSMVLSHLNQIGLFLCARTNAGQPQNAMTFFISHLIEFIQLVDGYARSSQAPPPYPAIPTPTHAAAPPPAATPANAAGYEAFLQQPNFPIAFASNKGLSSVPVLPDSTLRVCEIARSRLPSASRTPVHRTGSASASTTFPYAVSLGVDAYSWFQAHLRQMLQQCIQCLLETVLTEIEIIDPLLMFADQETFDSTIHSLLNTYQKIWEDATRQHVPVAVRMHLLRCCFRNLSISLFNHVLSFKSCMTMFVGSILKQVRTTISDWVREHAARSETDLTQAEEAEIAGLERIVASELAPLDQLAMILMMPKQALTMKDLAAIAPDLTPVTLYHLLLNYLPPASNSNSQQSEEEDYVNESVLEELTDYQTYWLGKDKLGKSGGTMKFPILFPAWQVHPQPLTKTDHEEEEDDHDGEAFQSSKSSATPTSTAAASLQKPLLDASQSIPVPRLSVRSAEATPLRLSSVGVPQPLRENSQFAFLNSTDELTLSITKG